MTTDHEPLIRVMALHAVAYCERLFFLEEVEEIRVADAAVYAGRTLHEDLEKTDEALGKWTSFEIESTTLGLVGKLDCLVRSNGKYVPYEHKRGRSRRDGKTPCAWPSDALQVSAYGMLVEEQTGKQVSEGRIRYHTENVTVKVPLNELARQSVLDAVKRAREIRASTQRPPIPENEKVCVRCSLSPVCLPEEERLAHDPDWEPIRLFPPDRDVKTIHVTQHGSRVSRSGNTLKVFPADGDVVAFPIHLLGSMVLHGYVQISTQALHMCASNGIPVHLVSGGGRYVGGLVPGAGSVQRRLRQYEALSDPTTCMRMARTLAMAKVEGALRYLLRATRGTKRESTGVAAAVATMRSSLKEMARSEEPDQLRGHEGMAGRAYFSSLSALLRDEVPEELRFTKRTRRPPRDRFNALLGFGYSLLYQAVFQGIIAVGLEPAIGFFHTPRSSAHPLVLDLMELFRVPLWDMALIGSVNRLQWNLDEDFSVTEKRVWLSSNGRKKAIHLFEKRLASTWRHPIIKYSLSYDRLIELEVRLLEKEWTGSPGLFARMRLR
jgi:CRISPR-associated protein Cas1